MKKSFGMLAMAALLLACNNETEIVEDTDSTIIKTDTTVVVPPDTATISSGTIN